MNNIAEALAIIISYAFKLLFGSFILAVVVALGLRLGGVHVGFGGLFVVCVAISFMKDRAVIQLHDSLLEEMVKLHNSPGQKARFNPNAK